MKNRNILSLAAQTLIAAALSLTLLAGCGGGGGSTVTPPVSGSSSRANGRAVFTIHWPARTAASRLVPEAANSVRIDILRNGNIIATQTVARTAGTNSATASFSDLPYDNLVANGTAFPNSDGSGVALAAGSVPVPISSGVAASVSLTMASTIDHISLTPSLLALTTGQSQTLAATAYDGPDESKANVVLTSPDKLAWTVSGNAATVDSSGKVTAVQSGSATVTVTDSESSKSASSSITVTTAIVPTPITSPPPTPSTPGTISFQSPVAYPVPSPYHLAIGDLNGDGNLDIAVTAHTGNQIMVLYGNGDGTFQPAVSVYTSPDRPEPNFIGDFDGDGKADILCRSDNSSSFHILYNNGDGTFTDVPYPAGSGTSQWMVMGGDFDGDGKLDVVASTNDTNFGTGKVMAFRNLGGRSFAQTGAFANGQQGSIDLAVGDVDGDGIPDIVATNSSDSSGSGYIILHGLGNATFQKAGSASTGNLAAMWPVIADFDRDGKADLAISDYWDQNYALLKGTGGGAFTLTKYYADSQYPMSAVAVDLDGDGWPDLVTGNGGVGVFSVMQNINGTLSDRVSYTCGGNNARIVGTGDFNHDGKPDLVFSCESSNSLQVMINSSHH